MTDYFEHLRQRLRHAAEEHHREIEKVLSGLDVGDMLAVRIEHPVLGAFEGETTLVMRRVRPGQDVPVGDWTVYGPKPEGPARVPAVRIAEVTLQPPDQETDLAWGAHPDAPRAPGELRADLPPPERKDT